MAYVDTDYYTNTYKGQIDAGTIEPYLERASGDIDILTFSRINAIGWDNLTSFQQEKICTAVCEQAEFRYNNSDIFESPFSSYSINGVSMTYGNASYYDTYNGIPMANSTFGLLRLTGLTAQMFYPPEVRA